MPRLVPALAPIVAVAAAVGCGGSRTAAPRATHQPPWLAAAERQALRGFGSPEPVRTYVIAYPRKLAVVWQFDHAVVCGICSAPSNAQLPRGRVLRVAFDRATHGLGGARNGVAIRFCEVRGSRPPLASCLVR